MAPLSSRGPLALLFSALVLKSGGWIECLSTVYQQKDKDQVTSQNDSSFLPNQSLCPQRLCPHEFIFRIQTVRAGGQGQSPGRKRDGVIRCRRGAARALFLPSHWDFNRVFWVFLCYFFKRKCLWFPPSRDN